MPNRMGELPQQPNYNRSADSAGSNCTIDQSLESDLAALQKEASLLEQLRFSEAARQQMTLPEDIAQVGHPAGEGEEQEEVGRSGRRRGAVLPSILGSDTLHHGMVFSRPWDQDKRIGYRFMLLTPPSPSPPTSPGWAPRCSDCSCGGWVQVPLWAHCGRAYPPATLQASAAAVVASPLWPEVKRISCPWQKGETCRNVCRHSARERQNPHPCPYPPVALFLSSLTACCTLH